MAAHQTVYYCKLPVVVYQRVEYQTKFSKQFLREFQYADVVLPLLFLLGIQKLIRVN